MTGIRRAGSRWRLLAHQMLPDGACGDSIHVKSDAGFGCPAGEVERDSAVRLGGVTTQHRVVVYDGFDLDEVVAGGWLHAEQLDVGVYRVDVGGVVVTVRADPDGRPQQVTVSGPDEADPVEGCTYTLRWTAEDTP